MLVSVTAQPRMVLPEQMLTILVSKILGGRHERRRRRRRRCGSTALVTVAMDGEGVELSSPLEFAILTGALHLLGPKRADTADVRVELDT